MVDYGNDIILRGQTIGTPEHPDGQTVCIVVQNIEYSTTIIQLPGISNEDFKSFIYANVGDSNISITDLPKQRDAVCAPLQLVQHYKIVSDKYTLNRITHMSHNNEYKNGNPVTYQKDKYFRPNDPIQTTTWYVSSFMEKYSQLYNDIYSKQTLEGFDKIIFKHLKYPFRDVVQDYKAVQRRYNINFMDTIRIPVDTPCVVNGPDRNYDDNGIQIEYPEYKYAADVVYYVDIKDIQQSPQSLIVDTLGYYKGVMFDIENAVYTGIGEPSYTMRDAYIKHQVKGYANDIAMSIFANDNTNATCDYNEIICISFVEQGFDGQIGKKIALIRGGKDISNEHAKTLINYDYQDKKQTQNDYADEVIIAQSEKELLQHTINILTSRKYHCIMHFNGWSYDERVIMTRMALHGLLQQYLDRLQRVTNMDKQYINPAKAIFKLTASRAYKHISYNTDPLYPSVDVCLLNLQQDTNAQKHEDGSLQTLLEYYGLGLKGDVSYQELNDWWQARDYSPEKLFKGFWYCQRDSIQQCKLQSLLKIVAGMIPFTTECNIPLQTAIQRAVGQKVEPAVTAAYHKSKTAFINIPVPYNEPYVLPDKYVVGQDGSNKQKLDGGEVYAFKLGFSKYISAVDGASMYPAQCEGNNIDNSTMLFAKDMAYVMQNKDKFHIKQIQTYKLKDIYAPYYKDNQQLPYDELPELQQNYVETLDDIFYISDSIAENTPKYIINQKAYRWRVVFTYEDQYAKDNNIPNGTYTFEQMFFTRKLQECQYNYVFYLQGKDSDGRPFSPRASMLTKFRHKRNAIKKMMDQSYKSGNTILGNYYNSQQNAIKILMNSTYGTTDSMCFCMYENIGAAAITYGSRSMIQYCRDGFIRRLLKLPKDFDMTKLQQYNDFCNQVLQNPDDLLIRIEDQSKMIIKIPVINPKYQDTDSNYILMPMLDTTQVIDRYKEQERYVKTRLFGHFNDLFCEIINKSMNRFPLKFAFEGAFYRAWHLSKKCYMGQSVDPECCDLAQQDDVEKGIKKGDVIINKGCTIHEHIKVANFDPDSNDIYKYMKSEHFKVTGVKLTRRDAPMLIKQIILQFVEKLLNQNSDDNIDIYDIIVDTIRDVYNNIDTYPINRFAVNKKLNSKDLQEGGIVHKYNETHQNNKLGVGQMMSTIIVKPDFVIDEQKLKGSKFSAADNKRIITDLRPHDKPYVAYYLEQVASTLLAFARTEETTETTQHLAMQLLEQNHFVIYGNRDGRLIEENIPKIIRGYKARYKIDKLFKTFHDTDDLFYVRKNVDKWFEQIINVNRQSNSSRLILAMYQDLQ